jgi:MYXO-CTERM domain-containing protein
VNLTCPVYNGCSVVGSGTPAQAAATVDGGYVASVTPDGGIVLSPAPAQSKGGGCTTSPGDGGSGVGLGVLAGLLGLVAARAVRARRRG